MEFDDLKQIWNAYDQKLAASMRLNTQLLQRANMGRVQTSLDRLARGLTLEAVINFVAVLLIGSFAADHVAEARFLIPAILLGVYAVAILATGISQLVRIRTVDYDEPVISIQRKLEQLKANRSMAMKWALLTAPLMWVPLLIVGLGAAGVDAYATLGASYLTANALFGLALIPLALWLAKRYGPRLQRSPVLRTLADDLTGRSLIAALQSLDTLARFERD
jgi:hypothetical protein